MEPEQTPIETEQENKFANLKKVTPLSKYLAMILFITLPFIGGWIGYTYAPEKVVEVERVAINEFEVENVTEEESVSYKKGQYIDEIVTLKEIGQDSGGGDTVHSFIVLNLSPEKQTEDFIFIRLDDVSCVDSRIDNDYTETIRVKGVIRDVAPVMGSIILSCYDEGTRVESVVEENIEEGNKDEFVGAISTVIKKDDGYYLVSGGEFGVNMVSYKISDEDSLSKTIFKLIEGSHRINKEYKISDNVDIELISYQRGENDDNRYYVDASVLYDVYQGGIDKFYYYALPGEDYPFEIIMVDDQVVSINQIYVE